MVAIEASFMGLLPFIPFYLHTFQVPEPSMIVCFYRTYAFGTFISLFARGEYTMGIINQQAAQSIAEFKEENIGECEKFGATCTEMRQQLESTTYTDATGNSL
jgi:hypothetical protein